MIMKGMIPMGYEGYEYGIPYDPDYDEFSPDDFECDYWESDEPDYERMEMNAFDEETAAENVWATEMEALAAARDHMDEMDAMEVREIDEMIMAIEAEALAEMESEEISEIEYIGLWKTGRKGAIC